VPVNKGSNSNHTGSGGSNLNEGGEPSPEGIQEEQEKPRMSG